MADPALAPRIVLASASPRRQRLISWLGLDVDIRPVDVEERLDIGRAPADLAVQLAQTKAAAACSATPDVLCLGFDTIVVLDGAAIGKPASDAEARAMLEALSGRRHEVVTGVAIATRGRAIRSFAVMTAVEMRPLSSEEIERWLARGEHLGCAGAYNIEHHLAHVTEDECFQNVAGLPLCHLYAELSGCLLAEGLGLAAPVERCDATLGRRCRLGPKLCGLSG